MILGCAHIQRHIFRCFVEIFQVPRVVVHVHVGFNCFFRELIGGDFIIIEYLTGFFDFFTTHHGSQNRFGALLGGFRDCFCQIYRSSNTLRRVNNYNAMYRRVLYYYIDGADITLDAGISQDIDRVGFAPVSGQDLIQFVHGLLTQGGQFAASADECIGSQDGRSAGISDDRQILPFG